MRKWWFRLLAVLFGVLLFYGVVSIWWQPVVDPLPPTANIQRMRARFYDSDVKRQVEFDVPPDHWGSILSALRPARYDLNPAKWEVMGDLDINLRNGRPFRVDLYSVRSEGSGAFSAGETFEQRVYYRGGSTPALGDALEAAYKAAPAESKADVQNASY